MTQKRWAAYNVRMSILMLLLVNDVPLRLGVVDQEEAKTEADVTVGCMSIWIAMVRLARLARPSLALYIYIYIYI